MVASACLAVILPGLVGAAPMAPLSVPLQMVQADAVFVGKVTEVDAKGAPSELFKGDTRTMQIARVTITASYLGHPGKNVEVGFFPMFGRRPGVSLAKGDEVLFMMKKHPNRKNTYLADSFYSVVQSKTGRFAENVAEAKKYSAMLADPVKALKAKDAGERATAASMITLRYRNQPAGEVKTEAVPAEVRKLLLTALAEADWSSGGFGPSPLSAFASLGLTKADGWEQPSDFNRYQEAAKKWLKENASKYRMTRYVRGDSGPAVEP
jgi:hypothetical protein